MYSLSYGARDNAGRITQKTEIIGPIGTNNPGVTTTYYYDSLGRLWKAVPSVGAQRVYTYDNNGNRSDATYDTAQQQQQDMIVHFTSAKYGNTTIGYTTYGDLRTKTDTRGTSTFTYDIRGNLQSVTMATGISVTYGVDALM